MALATDRLLMASAAAVLLLVAGCAELREDVRQVRDALRKLRGREPAPPPPAPPVAETPPAATPAPATGITFSGNCTGRDETGYAESAQLQVAAGEVRGLEARMDIPGRGSCRFQLADFRQTKRAPYVELLGHANAACALRVWQQQDRITLAATDCADRCTRGAFDYLWPVEFRAPGGGCY